MPDLIPLPARFTLYTDLIEILSEAAVDHAKRVAADRKFARRKRIGDARKPGPDTPLWNALIEWVQPHLARRGAKSNLARVLGLPRQRVYDYFTRRTMMPDGEAILHLLLWLAAQESTLEPGRHARPVG